MFHLYKAVANRMERLLMASANLSEDCLSGSNILNLSDSSDFTWENLNIRYPEVVLQDSTSVCTGKPIPGGYDGMPEYDVINVSNEKNEIILDGNVSKDWLVSNSAKVRRAPGGIIVKDVRLGDLAVVNIFPTVCIVPSSKRIEWKTFSGTMDTMSIDFIIYVEGADSDRSTEDMMKVTDVVEYILMTNLHIQPVGAKRDYQVTSSAKINSIEYGVVQKGSQFVKAAKITWDADMYIWRGYLTQQGQMETPIDGPF